MESERVKCEMIEKSLLPLIELGVVRVEFEMTLASGIGELADPASSASKKRGGVNAPIMSHFS